MDLARHAARLGCPVLAPPPFFLGTAGPDGIADAFGRLIDAVGTDRLRLLLYNIPQVSGFPLPPETVATLAGRYPGIVIGVKDSALDWEAVATMLRTNGALRIAVGAEEFIPRAMALGGCGTICGLANIAPGAVAAAVAGDAAKAEALARLAHGFEGRSFQPTLKAVIAELRGDEGWRAAMPPVEPVSGESVTEIVGLVRAIQG